MTIIKSSAKKKRRGTTSSSKIDHHHHQHTYTYTTKRRRRNKNSIIVRYIYLCAALLAVVAINNHNNSNRNCSVVDMMMKRIAVRAFSITPKKRSTTTISSQPSSSLPLGIWNYNRYSQNVAHGRYYNKRYMITTTNGEDGSSNNDKDNGGRTSVTGIVYSATATGAIDDNDDHPVVQLYTKEGCTLCDKVAEMLKSIKQEQPHTLQSIDITDPDKTQYYNKYKYDIPVLHINNIYWTKHKLDTAEEAMEALMEARGGAFVKRRGEPDAAAMEQRMKERRNG